MEGLAPPLELLLCVKGSIEQGKSVKTGVISYIEKAKGDFSPLVTRWLSFIQQGKDPREIVASIRSPYRRALMIVLQRGLLGEPIYPHLVQLEIEIVEACHDEVARNIAKLPIYLMVPLLLFQFPAFLILLFGPLLQNFFTSFGGQ